MEPAFDFIVRKLLKGNAPSAILFKTQKNPLFKG